MKIWAVCLMAIAAVLPQRVRTLSHRASDYVLAYQRSFVSLVADETTVQTVWKDGAVTATRTTEGELFSTFLDDRRTWMSIHDISRVDGAPVVDRLPVREWLTRSTLAAIGNQVAASNARFNIGPVTRNFNEPTLALLFLTPEHLDAMTVDRDDHAASGPGLVTLRFRSRGPSPLVRSLNGLLTASGTVTMEPDSGRVHDTRVTFADPIIDADLHTVYEYDPHVEQWVPSRFVEHYARSRTGDVTHVESTFTNYRRFETRGRLVTTP